MFLVDSVFWNKANATDLISLNNWLYICLYIFSYILPHSLFINSLNLSSGIGITGEEEEVEVLEEEKGREGVLEEGTKETEGTKEGILEDGRNKGTIEEGTKGTEKSGLSSFIIFRYCPCCFLECAIISAFLLYSSSVFWPLL